MCFFPLNEMETPLGFDFSVLRMPRRGPPGGFDFAGGMLLRSF